MSEKRNVATGRGLWQAGASHAGHCDDRVVAGNADHWLGRGLSWQLLIRKDTIKKQGLNRPCESDNTLAELIADMVLKVLSRLQPATGLWPLRMVRAIRQELRLQCHTGVIGILAPIAAGGTRQIVAAIEL